MNREAESHFSVAPVSLDMGRSIFNTNNKHLTTCNAGDLNVMYCREVLPGDTWSMDMGSAIRMTTPIFPVMDNCFVDFFWYFVPNRLVWDHWKEFMGENNQTAWEQKVEYEIPQITSPEGGWNIGTIADQMGIPTGKENLSISALPFRAYALVWNEWFRNENTNDPVMVNKDDATVQGSNATDQPVINAQLGAAPLKVCKTADYFTSCLPQPQKGGPAMLPLGELSFGTSEIPVYGNGTTLGLIGKGASGTQQQTYGLGNYSNTLGLAAGAYGKPVLSEHGSGIIPENNRSVGLTTDATKSGVVANLGGETLSVQSDVSINDLRTAFQIQKYLEKEALYGSRYTERIQAFFGVTSPDARLQRPEYLGGCRVPINIDQVIQTSASQQQSGLTTTPQGNAAAYSLTNYAGSMFTHSFTEDGIILGLYAIRQNHSYQQGLDRMWSRKTKYDFYVPVFANLGNQAVLNKEIFAQGSAVLDDDGNIVDDKAFGYQEAWAEYRYSKDYITGKFRSSASGTLDSWHYGDDYDTLPMLSAEWMNETDRNIQRTLAVDNEPQFICDFYFRNRCSRVMPLYSIPGLIDHH